MCLWIISGLELRASHWVCALQLTLKSPQSRYGPSSPCTKSTHALRSKFTFSHLAQRVFTQYVTRDERCRSVAAELCTDGVVCESSPTCLGFRSHCNGVWESHTCLRNRKSFFFKSINGEPFSFSGYARVFRHLLVDNGLVGIVTWKFWLLGTKPLWIFAYKSCCEKCLDFCV